MTIDSLWGEDFVIEDRPEKTKKILEKISKPKELTKVTKEKITKRSATYGAEIQNRG